MLLRNRGSKMQIIASLRACSLRDAMRPRNFIDTAQRAFTMKGSAIERIASELYY